MHGGRGGRVVEWRASGCLPALVALVVLTAVVATALTLGAFVVAGVAVLAGVLYAIRSVRRLLGGGEAPASGGQPWREVGREALPRPGPEEPRPPGDG